jgi:hypothetical protein
VPGSWGHLAARFVDVATARPLDPDERRWVEARLSPAELSLFDDQRASDRRHGLEAGLAAVAGGGAPEVVAAAILHDVGKRHARLGLVGRSVASVAIRLRLPLWRSARIYRDHGILGSVELERAGSALLAVDFARHHHGPRPAGFPPPTWALLAAADRARPIRRRSLHP